MTRARLSEEGYISSGTANPAYRYSQPSLSSLNKSLSGSRNISTSSSARLKKRSSWAWTLLFGEPESISSRQKRCATLFVLVLLIGVGLVAGVYFVINHVKSLQKKPNCEPFGQGYIRTVDGEFKVINREFTSELASVSSQPYLMMEREVLYYVDRLFEVSSLASRYNKTLIMKFRPGSVIVSCRVFFNGALDNAADEVGHVFRKVLELTNGSLAGGSLKIDIGSVIFRPSVSWSSWSQWSSCFRSNKCDPSLVRRRLRNCQNVNEVEKALSQNVCQWQGVSVEEKKCVCSYSNFSTVRWPKLINNTTLHATNSPTPETLEHVTNGATTDARLFRSTETFTTRETLITAQVSTTTEATTYHITKAKESTVFNSLFSLNKSSENSAGDSRRPCHECYAGEICLLRLGELMPYCVPVKDSGDSSSCGGWCNGPFELCDKLDKLTYQCIDQTECLLTEWKCGSGLCIPKERRCDGHFNCFDSTDELNCVCSKQEFHCGNWTSCIARSRRCDGYIDCWDGNDENNCTSGCSSSDFTCMNGNCIPVSQFCDRYVDCADQSDEPNGCDLPCTQDEHQCKNGRCILSLNVCDGVDNCGDNSDELNCDGKYKS